MSVWTTKLRTPAFGLALASTLIVAGPLQAAESAKSGSSKQENIGVVSGLTVGALAGGPIGAVIGAATGAFGGGSAILPSLLFVVRSCVRVPVPSANRQCRIDCSVSSGRGGRGDSRSSRTDTCVECHITHARTWFVTRIAIPTISFDLPWASGVAGNLPRVRSHKRRLNGGNCADPGGADASGAARHRNRAGAQRRVEPYP